MSAVLILLTLGGIVGAYLFFRRRKSKANGFFGRVQLTGGRDSADRDREERVPLATAEEYELDEGIDGSKHKHRSSRSQDKGKGKQRMQDGDESDAERGQTVFSLGDEDEH